MLSVIFITDEQKDGKYELTEARLKELLQQAYNQGYEAGQNKPRFELQPYTLQKGITPIDGDKINDPFWYERQTKPWWSEVTCGDPPQAHYPSSISTNSTDSVSGGFKGKVTTTLLNTTGQKCMCEGDLFPTEECKCQGVCHCGGDKE